MKCPASLVRAFLFVAVMAIEIRGQALSYEPMSVVKTLLGNNNDNTIWRRLSESGSQVHIALQSAMKPLLRKGQAVLLSVRGKLVLQEMSGDVSLANSLVLPNPNVLSLLGTSIQIFFEGFKPEVLTDKLGSVLKEKDKSLAHGHETDSLLDLLNFIPSADNDVTSWKKFNQQSESAFEVGNKLLGNSAREAWQDSFMGVEMDDAEYKEGVIKTQLSLVTRFATSVANELKTIKPLKKIPHSHSDRFAFGWWLNCRENSESCHLQSAPSGMVFSISSQLRIYIVPSLDTTLIVADTFNAENLLGSFDTIVKSDDKIWQEIKNAIQLKQNDQLPNDKVESRKIEREADAETNEVLGLSAILQQLLGYFKQYLEFLETLNWFYRGLVFSLFVIFSHYICYCGFHSLWLFGTTFSKSMHEARPRGTHAKEE